MLQVAFPTSGLTLCSPRCLQSTGEGFTDWMTMNPHPELPDGYIWGNGTGTHCTYYLEASSQPSRLEAENGALVDLALRSLTRIACCALSLSICPLYLQGAAAMAHTIVEDSLEYAIGTNNAAVMLTLAKTVAMLNNQEAIARRSRGTIDTIPGAPKSPRLLRQETIDLVNERVSAQNLETVGYVRSHGLPASPWP